MIRDRQSGEEKWKMEVCVQEREKKKALGALCTWPLPPLLTQHNDF